MFDLDLIETKEVDGYTVRYCNDDWYDYIEICKNGAIVVRIYPANFDSVNIEKIIENL